MSEELSAREQILRHIANVDVVSKALGEEPPAEWQELRRRFEAFDAVVQALNEDGD